MLNILILPNLHVSNSSIYTGGMEIATEELANSLHLCNIRNSKYKLILASHPESIHLKFRSDILFAKKKIKYKSDFKDQGDINDILLREVVFDAIMKYESISLILDQTSSLVPVVLSKVNGIRCIKTIRLNSNLYKFENEFMPDCIVHATEFSRALKNFNCRIEVIRDHFSISSYTKRKARKTHRAVSVGRVHLGKGHETALEISNQMDLPLFIIGPIIDKNFAEYLETCGAVLLGGLPRIEVLKFINESLVSIWTPNELEPGGRVVIESLKLGTPVIAKKTGIASDIIQIQNISSIDSKGIFYVIDKIPKEIVSTSYGFGFRYLELIDKIISSD